MQHKKDSIAIIGAGIVGVCAAIELRLAGKAVMLIDENPVAEKSCSIGNTGHIGADVFPLAQKDLIHSLPQILLDKNSPLLIPLATSIQTLPWLLGFVRSAYGARFRRSLEAMRYLTLRSIDDTFDLYHKAGIANQVKKSGCFFLYRNSREFKPALKQWQIKEKMGLDFEVFHGKAIGSIEPALKPGFFEYGVLTHHWAKVSDPKEVLLLLFDYAKEIGVEFQQASISNIKKLKDGDLSLTLQSATGQTEQTYPQVLIAAGIGSKKLAALFGEKLEIAAARGYTVTYPNPHFRLKQSILIRPLGLSVSSLNSGFRVGGLVELTLPNQKMNGALHDRLNNLANDFFEVESSTKLDWMHSRPATYDSAPILSVSRRSERLFYATGHGHWGLSFSASSAKIIKDLMVNPKNSPKEYQLYSINRFN